MLGVGLALRVRPIHVAGLLQRAISMQQLPRSSCDSETRLHPCGQIRSFAQKDDSTRDGLVEQQQEKRSGGLVARRTKEETAALIEKLRSRCAISFSLVLPERNVQAICGREEEEETYGARIYQVTPLASAAPLPRLSSVQRFADSVPRDRRLHRAGCLLRRLALLLGCGPNGPTNRICFGWPPAISSLT